MRLQHPTDIATFTIEIAGIPGNLRMYGTTDDLTTLAAAIDAKGLIVSSVMRLDAMSPGRALEIIGSIVVKMPDGPVPEPEFDPDPGANPPQTPPTEKPN